MALEPLIGRHHPLALKVRELLEPVVRRRGLELVDIQYVEGGSQPVLRLFADAAAGISLNVLEELTGTVGDVLDAEDPIAQRYTLEVSSPGLERPLTKRSHFEAALGDKVLVRTEDKVDGSRQHRGVLSGISDTELTLQVDGTAASRALPLLQVRDAHLVYEFVPAPRPGKKPAAPGADAHTATTKPSRRKEGGHRRGGQTE